MTVAHMDSDRCSHSHPISIDDGFLCQGATMETRRFRLRKRQRLRGKRLFARAFREGAHAADAVLVVLAVPNEVGWTRLGVSIPRRVGNAVTRNRWKRWIREAFRLTQHDLPSGLDLVVRPRKGAQGDARRVRRSLPKLARIAARRLERSSLHSRSSDECSRRSSPGS